MTSNLTLGRANPELLQEALFHVEAGNMSASFQMLRADEAKVIAKNLAEAIIESRCGCGQDDCATYRFRVPKKSHAVSYYTVRLLVRGEMQLHIDSDGDVVSLERLYENDSPRTTVRLELRSL